jgi:hypothetical protein
MAETEAARARGSLEPLPGDEELEADPLQRRRELGFDGVSNQDYERFGSALRDARAFAGSRLGAWRALALRHAPSERP